jgi:AraC-like DNA-binding protein
MKAHTFNEYGKERLSIYEVNGSTDLRILLKANKYHLIVITSGEMTVDVNFRIFRMGKRSSLQISSGETIREISTSADMKGYHVIYSPEFQTEMRTTRKSPISLQLKKEYPYQEFTEKEYELIHGSLTRLIGYINDPGHLYQSILIKNEIYSLQLNISDKRRKQHGNMMTGNATYQEVIRNRFKNLVEGHCDKQHSVSWYANAMFISPDYLSKIIREYDGTSARAWINASIIEKARFLMQQSDLTLKDISDRLNFPDQSSFGRFFKSNTGQSPKEFRKTLTDDNL